MNSDDNWDAVAGGHGSTGGAVVGWRPTGEPDEPAENYVERML